MSEVKRYDCTNGKAQHCYGCYEMTETNLGDYVKSEDFDRVTAERDALQQRLTAADERADTATSLIQRIVANFDTEIEFHEDVEPNDLEHDQVLAEMRVFLDTLKPAESSGKPCACPGCDSPRRANSPFCVAHRSAKSRTRGQAPLTADGLEC
ncbi:hypothetical protein ACEK06_22695 [Pseudomonas brenneri]|uniref:hypothetical protein n=1 Tax=Pseudomonas brenneri TaxID=129817 RepID=UPI0035709D02